MARAPLHFHKDGLKLTFVDNPDGDSPCTVMVCVSRKHSGGAVLLEEGEARAAARWLAEAAQ